MGSSTELAWQYFMTGVVRHRSGEQRDLRAMLREVTRPNGVQRLLRWLGRHVEGWAVLIGPTGEPVCGVRSVPSDVLADAADAVDSVVARRCRSAAIDVGAYAVRALAIDRDTTLVVARHDAFPAEAGPVIADVANLLRLQWRADQVDRRHREVAEAESLTREAVLHLLMVGQLDAARRSAGALRHELPNVLRLYLIECRGERDEPARLCSNVSGGSAWIIRCPVYTNHLIVLASAEEHERSAELDEALRELAAIRSDLRIGTGHTVPLRDTHVGYEQAFHALTIARNSTSRFAVFSSRTELATLLGTAGQGWASDVLAPLLGYVPERSQDPDSKELFATLESWLNFFGRATGQLKIHRNTLATRLRRIERILGLGLDDLASQAKLHLALRIHNQPRRYFAQEHESLDALLHDSSVRRWAQAVLSPLQEKESLLTTLRVWLHNNARLEDTAATVGVSVPGVRKRLLRIEEILGRSLLNGPSARYDLLLALRIHDDAAF
jgi:sugar diacid utilization regulator